MDLKLQTEKQLKNRMRFLADKMELLWEEMVPKINEFEECKNEFELITAKLSEEEKNES